MLVLIVATSSTLLLKSAMYVYECICMCIDIHTENTPVRKMSTNLDAAEECHASVWMNTHVMYMHTESAHARKGIPRQMLLHKSAYTRKHTPMFSLSRALSLSHTYSVSLSLSFPFLSLSLSLSLCLLERTLCVRVKAHEL